MKWFCALVTLVCAASAAGQAMAQPRSSITNPDWLERPSGEDVAAHYPVLAAALGVEGYAVVACKVNVLGKLVDCRSTDEQPATLGFGAAAVAMSDKFKMRPMALNGVPVDGGNVRIPIRFKLPSTRTPAAPLAPVDEESRKQALRLVDALELPEANARANRRYDRTFDEEDEGVALASHNLGVAIVRKAWIAHHEDVRAAYATAMALVFSANELREQADFFNGPGWTSKDASGVPTELRQTFDEFARNQSTAAHQAFCIKQKCATDSEIVAVWRAAAPGDDHLDTPQWLRTPSEYAVQRATPPLASAINLKGAVRLTCRLDAEGAPEKCVVDEEAPAGIGYGGAALKLAGGYRLSPIQLSAGAAGRKVTVRVGFSPRTFGPPYAGPTGQTENALALARALVANASLAQTVQRDIEVQVLAFQGERPDGADAKTYDSMIDAYRAGAYAAALQTAELQARVWAAAKSEEQLAAMVAYQASAGGKAQRERSAALEVAIQKEVGAVNDRINDAARAEFCKVRDCSLHLTPQPAELNPAPSTRNP